MPDQEIIYVLFHETNTGHFDDSDGYVEHVYEAEADAEAARLACIREARDDGREIWFDPDHPDGDEQPDNPHWQHDWRVEAHIVIPKTAHD